MRGLVPESLASKQAGRAGGRAIESGTQSRYSTRVSMYLGGGGGGGGGGGQYSGGGGQYSVQGLLSDSTPPESACNRYVPFQNEEK